LRDGDVLQYNVIEKRLVGKPSLTGLALRSESIERFKRLDELGFYESQNLSIQDSKFVESERRELFHEQLQLQK
jgi:hypothetical protein